MHLVEIWCEGDPKLDYTACHLGYGKGPTLADACIDLASRNRYFAEHYSATALSYKGCKLFDNELEARELWN